MYKIKEAIIVEGVYDKIKLSSFIDGIILTTHGFAVYSNDDFKKTISTLANRTGIVVLTDSDFAGMQIRNFVKQVAKDGEVKHAYIPDIAGKEKRKSKPSAEGLLGVEAMDEATIIKALRDAGCTIDNVKAPTKNAAITKTHMYMLGMTGQKNSTNLRKKVCECLDIPAHLSANMLLDVLNRLVSFDELVEIVQRISQEI